MKKILGFGTPLGFDQKPTEAKPFGSSHQAKAATEQDKAVLEAVKSSFLSCPDFITGNGTQAACVVSHRHKAIVISEAVQPLTDIFFPLLYHLSCIQCICENRVMMTLEAG